MNRSQFALFCLMALLTFSPANQILGEDKPAPLSSGPQTDGRFCKVILEADQDVDGDGNIDDVVVDAMELSVAGDGRVFYAERNGTLKVWKPASKSSVIIGRLNVFTGMEDGLLGIALDPGFLDNDWIYLFYSMPETGLDKEGKKIGENRVSRFTLSGDSLEPASEKVLLRIATQREQCCHSGGSLAFDGHGNLLVSVGDNTHPGESDGYSPLDEQPGRGPWNAQKSASNSNDLRGKILRIHPEPDGPATIPKGNLFSPGTPLTRPEIYILGNRNPFRISVDQRTGFLYWGEVGPDAGAPRDGRGPAGFDEINQARSAGNFGWPYFVADNKAYNDYDFATKVSGSLFDPAKPINHSIYNTGLRELPPAQASFIAYPYGPSTKFPVVNGGGGRTAMAGPVYYFDPDLKSDRKLPAQYDHTLFIYEWSRNWIITVKLDANDHIEKMERFCPNMTFKRPMDMELGPDGCLYIIENGTAWSNNTNTQIIRIEYTGDR
jgi:cytochrome c